MIIEKNDAGFVGVRLTLTVGVGKYPNNYTDNLFTGSGFSHIMTLAAGRKMMVWRQTSRKTYGLTGNSAD